MRRSTTGTVLGAEGPVRPDESTKTESGNALSTHIAKRSCVKNVDWLEQSADGPTDRVLKRERRAITA